jgi:hypothetical protein
MRNITLGAAVAALLNLVIPARAEMEIAPPVKVSWNGFAHAWAGAGENAKREYVNSGVQLKRLRFKMTAEAYDGLTVVILPELVPTFTLLDGYVAVDLSKYVLDFSLPLTVTMGQFKTPFGLNRMYLPPQLLTMDYSRIYNGATGVMGTTSFWDDGVMLSYKQGTLFKVDAAWVEGLGPNIGASTGTTYGSKPNQDFAAKVDVTPFGPILTVGGSVYYGEAYGAAGVPGFPGKPKVFSGAHAKVKLFGKSFEGEAEMINRTDDRMGYTVSLGQFIFDWLQLAGIYDHVTDYKTDKSDNTRYLGGLNFYPGGPFRIGVMEEGTASGPSQQPVDSKSILQAQVTW